ncbi:MAG: hypothetical protein ACMUHB_07315, partial [Thermoplasmatota archaeon]
DAVLPEGLTSETLPYLIFQGEAVMYLASEDPFLSEGALKNVICALSGVHGLDKDISIVKAGKDHLTRRLAKASKESVPVESERDRLTAELTALGVRVEEMRLDIGQLEERRKASMKAYRMAISALSGIENELGGDNEMAISAARLPLLKERITEFLERAPAEILRKPAERAITKCMADKEERTRKRILFGAYESQVSIVESILRTRRCLCGSSIGRTGAGRERLDALVTRLREKRDEVSDWGQESIWTADATLESVRRRLASIPQERRELLEMLREMEDANSALMEIRSDTRRTKGGMKDILARITEHERTMIRLESARKELKETIRTVQRTERSIRKLDGKLLKIWGKDIGAQGITDAISTLEKALSQMEDKRKEVLSDTRERIEERANETVRSIDMDPMLGDIRIHPGTFRLGREKPLEGGKRVIPMAFLSAGEREILAISILSSFPLLTGGSLILDSPFPHLDEKRRSNLMNALPKLSDRVYLSLPDGSLSQTAVRKMARMWTEAGKEFLHYILEPSPQGSILRKKGGRSG